MIHLLHFCTFGWSGNGYAGLRLRTTRRTKGSAHIAHAYSHQVLTALPPPGGGRRPKATYEIIASP